MHTDLLRAVRWLRKNPLFTASITMILALGIGANTAVFSIVDAVLLQPLPYESPERLVRIEENAPKRPMSGVAAEDYLRWKDRSDLFEQTVPFIRDTVTLTGDGDPDQIVAMRASGALFSMLGVRPRLGRSLLESDDDPAAPRVAVISDRLWQRRFHSDPQIVGQAITVSEEIFTIAGIMPREFAFPSSDVELWVPLRVTPAFRMWFQVVARLKPGVTVQRAGSALQIVARQLEQEDPQHKSGLRLDVTLWSETPDRKYELTLLFVFGAVGLVLLIACADVGSLLLSRAVQRQREIAIRASLGAGAWRVARQLLAESLVLTVLGSVLGISVAHYALQFLSDQLAALPIAVPHLQRVSLNGRVLLFNTGLCVLLSILCSLAPVVLAFRTDVQSTLRGGRSSAGPKGSSRLFSMLIATEAAFAFLLLLGSGLTIRSLVRLQQEDHGFRPDHVLTLRIPVGMRTPLRPGSKYDTRPRQIAYYSQILERVQQVPGTQAVAIVNNLPLSGVNTSLSLPGTANSARTISPQYFAAMGIPLLAGRTFTDRDQAGAPRVAIINQFMARQLFPDRSPLGQPLPSAEPGPPVTVVGVVKDTSQLSYELPVKGEIYLPMRQFVFGTFMSTIVVRTPGDPLALASELQKAVWDVDPDQPVVKVQTMEDIVDGSIWRPRFSAWIFSVFGGLAVLLTSAGIYGVVAYTTSFRTTEVGIRLALGATPRDVFAVILRSALVPLGAGLVASVLAAPLLSRLMASVLYEIRGTDPLTYVGAVVLLLVIGVTASALPAWRAAISDPARALRAE